MADLFDMKVGGLGFHLTAHMIALAALFVACFAITGYITFRDGSITEKKLDGANFLTEGESVSSFNHNGVITKLYKESVTIATGADNGGAGQSIALLALTLPLGATTVGGFIQMPTAGAGTDLGVLTLEVGDLTQCTVGGSPTIPISGGIDFNGTTLVSRTSPMLQTLTQNTGTDLRFAITSGGDVTATVGGDVIDCYITVMYPPGVTPV